MELDQLDELERAVTRLRAVIDGFPIGAVSLDDFKPVEEKIWETRESLMRLNVRSLLLRAKHKRTSKSPRTLSNGFPLRDFYLNSRLFTEYIDDGRRGNGDENNGGTLQNVVNDTLINARAVKLCLHSTTILSILSEKEGDEEDRK